MKHLHFFYILFSSFLMINQNTYAELFFVTSNPGKFKEVSEILKPLKVLQLDIDLEEIQSTNAKEVIEAKVKEAFSNIDKKIVERRQKSFKSNEAQKNFDAAVPIAKTAFAHGTAQVIIEDTSLYFDGMKSKKATSIPNGLPGPLIKWFVETVGNDGLYKIAQAFGNFDAQAVTFIGYSKDGNNIQYFDGVVPGTIVAPTGSGGFGWDPIFKPEGYEATFATMSQEDKNKVSMRSVAARKLKEALSQENVQQNRVQTLRRKFESNT